MFIKKKYQSKISPLLWNCPQREAKQRTMLAWRCGAVIYRKRTIYTLKYIAIFILLPRIDGDTYVTKKQDGT